jgi:hypothetical protein
MASRLNDVESGSDHKLEERGDQGLELSARRTGELSARTSITITDSGPDEVNGTDASLHGNLRREWSTRLFDTNLKGFDKENKVSQLIINIYFAPWGFRIRVAIIMVGYIIFACSSFNL